MTDCSTDTPLTHPIMRGDEVVGHAYDTNPVLYSSDEQCRQALTNVSLVCTRRKEQKLIKKCFAVLDADLDENIDFGPVEVLELTALATRYPDMGHEILACVQYLWANIEAEGTVPTEIFEVAMNAHAMMNDIYERAVRRQEDGPLSDDDSDDSSNEANDEDSSEESWSTDPE